MIRTFIICFLILLCKASIYSQKLETVIQRGHIAAIKTVIYTPDGQYLLTGSRDKTIKLWDVETGRELRSFFGHTSTINDLDISADGKTFVSSSADGSAIIWDILTGKPIKKFEASKDLLTSVALSNNGKYIVTAGYDNEAWLWDIKTGEKLQPFKVNSDKGRGYGIEVQFGSDNETIYFGNDNRTVTAFNLKGEKLFEKKPEEGWCGGCATFIATNEKILVSSSNGASLNIHNLTTANIDKIIVKETDDNRAIALSNDSKYILQLTDKLLNVYTTSGDSLFSISIKDNVNDIAFSPDGTTFATADDNLLINIYDIATGKIVNELGGYKAKADKGGLDYNANSRWDYYIKKYTDLQNDLDISPDGKYLVKAKLGSIARVWHLESGKIISELRGHEKAVMSVVFSNDGSQIITGGADGTIRVWEVKTGKEILKIAAHRDVIFHVGLNDDGTKIISGSWDGIVKVFNIKNGNELEVIRFENGSAYKIDFFNGELYALIANLDKSLGLYELDSKLKVKDFIGHTDIIHGIDYYKNTIASVSWDGTLKVWDVATSLQNWRYKTDQPLYAVQINNEGNRIVCSGADRKIKMFDLASGKEVHDFEGHQSAVTNIKFSKDGKLMLSSSEDGMIKIWDLNTNQELISYISFDKNDWMAINKEGYFNATDGAFDKVVFVQGMKSYGAGQFFNQFYQPDLLERTFSKNTGNINLEDQLKKSPPPTLAFIAPHSNEVVKTDEIDIIIKVEDQGGGVKSVRLMHNSKLIQEVPVTLNNGKGAVNRSIPLIGGLNTIEAIAINDQGIESSKKMVTIEKEGKRHTSLYIVGIGINHYENASLNLNYAKADAQGFVNLVKEKSKPLFDKVEVIELFDEDATKENIFNRLSLLSKVIKPQDVLYFYYAGHGSMIDGSFYFVPTDNVKLYSQDKLEKTGIKASELQDKLQEIAALKQLLIIDACQSGGSVEVLAQRGAPEEKAMAQLSRSTGIHVLAAAGSEQFATEFKELGHGLFTYVLLEALSGKADGAPNDGKVTIYELKSYLDDQVPEFSKKHKGTMQFPHTFSRGQDFPIIIE